MIGSFTFRRWQANLRILDVEEIKTVPYAPLSPPFVERLIGTSRRECLDRTFFWTAADLETKLLDFQRYYKRHRAHSGLGGQPPNRGWTRTSPEPASIRTAGKRIAADSIRRRSQREGRGSDFVSG